jgi:hypothetical protein
MDSKIKVKNRNEGIVYNPALDRYTDVVMFPDKVAQAKENLNGRNLLKELDEADKKKTRAV